MDRRCNTPISLENFICLLYFSTCYLDAQSKSMFQWNFHCLPVILNLWNVLQTRSITWDGLFPRQSWKSMPQAGPRCLNSLPHKASLEGEGTTVESDVVLRISKCNRISGLGKKGLSKFLLSKKKIKAFPTQAVSCDNGTKWPSPHMRWTPSSSFLAENDGRSGAHRHRSKV